MGCIYQDLMNSKCSLFNDDIERPGCDEEGNCVCSDDEDPSYSCEDYQSIDEDSYEDDCDDFEKDCEITN